MKYVYPQLPGKNIAGIRLSSWGLGNLLFPWARAVVYAEKYNLKLIWPKWTQFHPGSWLRWELDKRTYHNVFRRPDNYLKGFPERILRYKEVDLSRFLEYEGNACLMVNRFMEGGFEPLLGHQSIIWKKLMEMSRFDLSKYRSASVGTIACHVRLGDMVKLPKGATTVDWYAQRIKEVRKFDQERPVVVYSDDKGALLQPLWDLPNVTRSEPVRAAICDIAAMSGSDFLIAGKGSTFSRWACFLSGMPVISHSHGEWWRDSWKPYSRFAVGLVGDEISMAEQIEKLIHN